MKNHKSEEILVVAVGASAGGIHALKNFFSTYDSVHSAIVIIQHMNESSKHILKEVIHTFTKLPVKEVLPHEKIEVGHVYICPPHKLVSVEKNSFNLHDSDDNYNQYTTIDFFMNSLASTYKERAVGVLLSGDGMDGVLGLKAISDNGGLTLVQDEKSAEHPSMPATAIDMGFVDYIANPENISKELVSYEKYLLQLDKTKTIAQLKEEIGASIISICDILYRHTHHDFKHYKSSTIIRRIQRRMSVLHIDKVDDYVNTLSTEKGECDALFNDLLINVTSFFRDAEAFDALKNEVLIPDFQKFTGSKKYRIWVAGCSTGQEPYTIAMLVRETLEELQLHIEVQIIATDIDEEALNIARRGDYPLSITDKVSPQRLEKFFVRRNGRYSVSKQLREMILFSSHNIINDPPFSQLDLISCRNVLIYLGLHLQKKLIPVFHYALKPNGHLFLGTSEALTAHKDLFNGLNAKFRIAQRKATAINIPAQSFFSAMTTSYSGHFKEAPQSHEEDLHLIGQRILLDEFSPKFAIISDECKILSVSAGFQEYLEPAEGTFQNNILKLVKQSLRSPLRVSINEAKKEKRQIQNQTAIVRFDRGLIKIGLVVQPMPQLGEHTGLYMVVFRDLGLVNEEVHPYASTDKVDSIMVDELERELAKLRDELERSVQDLEASNEELKSSNEELLSMNEELQSTNEELEVSKEEVQKGNEILINTNIDLENLLNSTKIATIFLDDKLNIRNFTPAVEQLYDLVPHDIGRSIMSFASKAKRMPAYSYPKDLGVNQVVETEVTMPDGRVFLRRKSPYVNQQKEMVGLVVTFVDVTEVRRSESLFRSLANTVPQMIFSTDHEGNYKYFSEQWLHYTGIDPSSIKNKGFREIIHPDDVELAIKEWNRVQVEQHDQFSFQYRLRNKHGEYRWHLLNARSVKDHNGRIFQWFGGCTDIQDQKEMEIILSEQNKDILRNQERFQSVADAINMGIWYCNLPFDVLHWSDIVKKQFWCAPDEEIRIDTFYERIHPDDRAPTKALIDDSIDNHKHYDATFRTVDAKTGELRWIRAIGWTDYNESGSPKRFDGVTFDITDSTRYMTNMKEAVRVRDEFLSIASHELKTPLTSMILQMQMVQRKIERGIGDIPMVLDANKLLLKQCSMLTTLIDDMLDVSRISNGKINFHFQPTSLSTMLKASLESFSINIEEKNIKIEVHESEDIIVDVDPFRFEQVIVNLLSNAVKYGQGNPIKISIKKDGHYGVFEVQDYGLGISPNNIDKIFNLFERAISSVNISGLGLGLYISKQIVNAHKGDIQVVSQLGVGSTFRVLIPIAAP